MNFFLRMWAIIFSPENDDESAFVINHIVVDQTEDQKEYLRKAREEAARKHGKPFRWGAKLELKR